MTQQDFSLKTVFSDLANDPSWPWTYDELGERVFACDGEYICDPETLSHAKSIAQSPLTIARLALDLVESQLCIIALRIASQEQRSAEAEEMMNKALGELGIKKPDYANVKKRVEEADTGKKPRRNEK